MTHSTLATDAAKFLRRRWQEFQPRTFIGLGSGLGDACNAMSVHDEIPFADVPGFAPPTVVGHAGRLRVGTWSGEPVLVMLGRMHLYEGHSVDRVVHPIRTAAALGVKNVVLTNMSGGTPVDWTPPLLAILDGHRDLQHGWRAGFEEGPFVGYTDRLIARMSAAAHESGIAVKRGVYAGLLGPNYETPAEVRALRALGCHMVGMSTVQEAKVARESALNCVAVSCVSNSAAGVSDRPVDHGDVVDAGRRIEPALAALLGAFLKRLHDEEPDR
jgi:purine-nucleoside phosphorylase